MKLKYTLVFLLTLGLFQAVFGQIPSAIPETQRSYLVGPGDEITGKVLGEAQFDFVARIDEDGRFQVPFFDQTIEALCRTEKDIRADVTKLLSKYLKNPQISVRVTDRKSRPPVVVFGEVRTPQQVDLRREARLLELISFAGGETEDAGGMVQIFRTTTPLCADAGQQKDWVANSENASDVPSRLYSLSSLRLGREEANPVIYPGDVIVVQKASPVYITGEVVAPQGIYLKEGGTSLTEAIAKVNGVKREAKTRDIKIYRLKANSKDREIISANYDLIKKGTQKDIMLEPYDIVEVDKSKKSIGQLVLETVVGVGRSSIGGFGSALPTRVLY